MRIILIALLLLPSILFAQFSPKNGGNIPNATTDFGVNFPKGITVYDTTAHKYYISIMAVSASDDLTSSAIKFKEVNTFWKSNGSDINYADGNVGVGLTNPISKLHVYNSDYGDLFLTNSTLGSRYGAGLRGYGVGGEGGRTELGVLDDGAFTKGISISSQGSLLQFFTGTSAGSLTERMRITPTGRVGIGTTAVNTELEVNGVIKATGGTSTDWNSYRTPYTNSNKDTIPVVLFVGNSLTTGWNCTTDTPPSNYVSVPTHNGVSYTKINIGVGGMKALWLDSAKGTTVIDNYHNRAGKNIMVLWVGINDLLGGRTPGQVLSSLEAFSSKYRALGWKVIVCTPPSCQPQTRNIDQRRYTYDSLIRYSYSNFADGLADLAIEPHIGPLGSYSNTTYFCDEIHLTTLGSQMAANVIQAALVELITNERNKSLNNIVNDTIFPNQVTIRANGYNLYHPQLRIQGVDDLHKKLAIGYNTSYDYSFLQSYQETVGFTPLLLNQDGGNVGIGTTAIGNDKLKVTGTSTENTGTPILNLTTGTGVSTDEQLQFGVHDGDYSWIQAVKPGTGYRNLALNALGGNIGIGTTAPNSALHIEGSALVIQLVNTAAGGTGSGGAYGGYMKNNPTAADQRLGAIAFGSRDGGTTARNGAAISAFSEGAWTGGTSHPSYITIRTAPSGGTTATEKVRVTSDGKMGIGTTAPATTLDVAGVITATGGTSTTWNAKEPALGNPASNGYVLSSTTAGVRSWIAAGAGTVTSVTASAPVVSTGGATPVISMPAANGSTDGYMSAAAYSTLGTRMPNVLTTAGDIVYQAASGIPPTARLPIGETGSVLTVLDGLPAWRNIPVLNQNTTGTAAGLSSTLAVSSGGTGTTTLTGILKGNGTSAITGSQDIDITGNIDADSSIIAGFKANGNSGTAINIYATQGNYQTVTRTGSCTYTIIGMKNGQVLTLEMIHEASATAYTCTFSPTLKFPGGTAPTWTNTSGAIDVISIRYDGTNYIAMQTADFK